MSQTKNSYRGDSPPEGVLKVNTNGSFKGNPGHAKIDGIDR